MVNNVIFKHLSLEFDILLQKKVLKVISHFHCPNGYVKDPFTAENKEGKNVFFSFPCPTTVLANIKSKSWQ